MLFILAMNIQYVSEWSGFFFVHVWIFFQYGWHATHTKKRWLIWNWNDENLGPWKEQTIIWTVDGMAFILWSNLIVKKSCNKESLADATRCRGKYWWRTERLVRITFKLPQGLPSQEILILWQRILVDFPVTRLPFSSAYFMWVQGKSFYIQKSHHSNQLIQRQTVI